MSVSQKMSSPRNPDYEPDEILNALRDEYGFESEDEWIDEFGMTPSEMHQYIMDEMMVEEDNERYKLQMSIDLNMKHNYEDNHWCNDVQTDEGEREKCYEFVRNKDNDQEWILAEYWADED